MQLEFSFFLNSEGGHTKEKIERNLDWINQQPIPWLQCTSAETLITCRLDYSSSLPSTELHNCSMLRAQCSGCSPAAAPETTSHPPVQHLHRLLMRRHTHITILLIPHRPPPTSLPRLVSSDHQMPTFWHPSAGPSATTILWYSLPPKSALQIDFSHLKLNSKLTFSRKPATPDSFFPPCLTKPELSQSWVCNSAFCISVCFSNNVRLWVVFVFLFCSVLFILFVLSHVKCLSLSVCITILLIMRYLHNKCPPNCEKKPTDGKQKP